MLLDEIPLWALYAAIVLLFFLSVELGLLVGRWRTNPEAVAEGMTAQTATVLGALLAQTRDPGCERHHHDVPIHGPAAGAPALE